MFKRPLFVAAVCLSLICFLLIKIFPNVLWIQPDLYDGQAVKVTGKIYRFETKTNSVYAYAETTAGKKIILIFYNSEFQSYNLKLGNTVKADCSYSEFSVARNEGNFDEYYYYRSLGIWAKFYVNDLSVTDSSVNLISQGLYEIKEKIVESVESVLNGDENAEKYAGVFEAMTTGDKSNLDSEIKSLYQSSGIAHILAISGLHISVLGMGLFSILRKKFRLTFSAIVSGSFVILFSVMSGWSASSVRAVIMFCASLLAKGLGKKYSMETACSLSAIILLLENPFYLTNSGFLLSFAAMISICLITFNLQEFLFTKNNLRLVSQDDGEQLEKTNMLVKKLKSFFQKENAVTKSLLSSLAISLGTLPIIISIYYEFPLYGTLLNLFVLPLVTYFLVSAVFGGTVGVISLTLGKMLIGVGVFIVNLITMLCSIFSTLPGSRVNTGYMSGWRICIYYLTLAAFVACIKQINRKTFRKACEVTSKRLKKHISLPKISLKKIWCSRKVRWIAFVLALALLFSNILIVNKGNALEISFLDVDQGLCVLVQSPNGVTYMLDCGSTGVDQVFKFRVESTLKYNGITTIDYFIISHPDTDHVSGLIEMLEDDSCSVKIKMIMMPEIADMESNENCQSIINYAAESKIEVRMIHAGMKFEEVGFEIRCLHPTEGFTSEDVNDYSAVLSLQYGSFDALFCGDITSEVESEIYKENLEDDYDLLGVPHHGSKYSSSQEFLERVNPEIAVISAGVDNSYGHPHIETLERLEECGSEVYVTAQTGEVKITVSKDGSMKVKSFLEE